MNLVITYTRIRRSSMNPTTPPPSSMKKLRPGLKKLTTGSPTRLSPTKLSPMRLSPTRPTHKKLNPKSSVMVDPNFGPSLKRKLKEELKEMVGWYDYETKRKRQKLRPHGSFSAEYWSQASDLALHLHDCTLVKHELSSRETGNDTSAEWLAPQVKALQTESRLYQQQAERLRMEPGDIEKVNSRAWMLLFTTSQCGLQINSGIGERDSNEQTAFRKELQPPTMPKTPEEISGIR